jgi:hypothetical protein
LLCERLRGLLVALFGVIEVVATSIVCGMLFTLPDVPAVCGILLAGLVVDKLNIFSCVGICLVVDWVISMHYSFTYLYKNTLSLRSTGLVRPYCSESKEEVRYIFDTLASLAEGLLRTFALSFSPSFKPSLRRKQPGDLFNLTL